MASSSFHQKGNGGSMFKSNSPHFFKIILHDTLRDGKLGIPTKFVRKYGNGMSSPALLRVPTGAVWKLELTKSDGKIWLKNGWQEFSNHYSLEFGHFLVFKYEGNSNFQVMIFDKSTSEIEYPYTSNNNGLFEELLQQNIEESEKDDSVHLLEDISSSQKMREKSELPCPRPHKMTRSSNSAVKTERNLKSEFLVLQDRHNGIPDRRGDKKVKALERASRAFKSENPFFLIFMQPSYVGLSKSCAMALALPTNFVRKHLMEEHCCATLCNSNGKTWTVGFDRRRSGKILYKSIRIGWNTFVQDNDLQIGDVCAFELLNCIEILFKVTIYKGQDANFHGSFTLTDVSRPVGTIAGASYQHQGCPKSLNPHQRAKRYQEASAFRSANPYFVVVLQPSYVTTKLNVPDCFARKYFVQKHKEVILVLPNGKSWPVSYYQHTFERPSGKLVTGWRRFVVDNNLEVGDVCAFELIEATVTSLKVTIYKNQVELQESSPIKIDPDCGNDKGGMSSLENQHPTEEFLMPNIKENAFLDDISVSQKNQQLQVRPENKQVKPEAPTEETRLPCSMDGYV